MKTIKFSHSNSKVKTLIDEISLAILAGKIKMGDNLPSINKASELFNVSRDTVFKAYQALIMNGLIASAPAKGYFVNGELNRILLLLDNYSSFKQDLYHRFAENLPPEYKVDLIFHQYNERLFETIIRDSIGKYSSYVVMNFSNEQFSDALQAIPPKKLLFLDFGNFEKSAYSYICQDFNAAFYNCLKSHVAILRKYTKICFVFPDSSYHPPSSIDNFNQFCDDFGFQNEVVRNERDWKGLLEKGTLYICILADDLVKIIKEADNAQLNIGSEIGIIAYNDYPMLELVKNGIAAMSVDFGLMGTKAAKFVVGKQTIQEYLPTELLVRASIL